ncbi:MAG: hypothetical protein CVV07_02885 [Gammaproteobacteria bacterium HGW-Gammaproteobacteria-11]|nr:MAG: hypothetical protein CVV07_02885 [Gammaproteobacteria bacterium HGW-Gammaproteobacteria-11]
MRSQTIATLALALVVSTAALAQDAGAPPAWTLKARIEGVEMVGDWELARIRATSGDSAADNAADTSQIAVAKDSTFQIGVDIVDAAGVRQDVSGSPKLIYRPQGCLSVNSVGVATVATAPSPRWTCNVGDVIPLTIVYKEDATNVAAMNMYLLKIE